ncbi:hypothetical protein COCON_G00172180 [Conger conger]|uniref:GRAM domain-containing protein n=1 Tax=Conger conger TaxID=82655 RepID=A0A9Q1D8R1_CONCO|nr:hypothetical protein COCON_G00172180 [Conger conger]
MVLITEPPPSILTPQTTPEELKSIKFSKKDVKTTQSNSETENGGKPGTEPLQVADIESDGAEGRKKPPLRRSKEVDQASVLQAGSDNEGRAERKKLSKASDHYHKLFKEVSKEELLRQSYTCALQKDMLYQGKLYVSDNWICFHSKVFGKGIKIAIPAQSVTVIKKTKTAILVPNALVVATADERHVFVSFLSRDTTYKFLKSTCPHLDVEKPGHGSKQSSTDSSFRSEQPSSLQLDSLDFSDLDGVVRKRREELDGGIRKRRKGHMDSSSSGSQTPDYQKPAEFPEFPALPQTYFKAQKKKEVAVHADVHLQKAADPKHGPHRNGHVKPGTEPRRKTPLHQPAALNTLLLLYLLLVCILVLSSCYMAFKIMSLEERLAMLGSLEYPQKQKVSHDRDQLDAEIQGELSTNLLKLDKVQRNLRKLLEET